MTLPADPPPAAAEGRRAAIDPALVVIAAGVVAALHIGKLPPAVGALQSSLGLGLVQAGFLLSLVQLAGATAGLGFGVLADGLGPRRSALAGLAILAVASGLGAAAREVSDLMVLRIGEGIGFLLVVFAAPALLHRLVAPGRMNLMLGLWSAYMPLGIVLALLAGSWIMGLASWRVWWAVLALATAVMAWWLRSSVGAPSGARTLPSAVALPWAARLRLTLGAPGPWLLAVSFALYSGPWIAVIGFLPTIYADAGIAGTLAGGLTAFAAAMNIVGNVAAGRMLHRGSRPIGLLVTGYAAMAVAAAVAFAGYGVADGLAIPGTLRYVAVLVFSMLGGLVPATLFTLAAKVAPAEGTLSTTVGWMLQGSALGQFSGAPVVAWVAVLAGGWHATWLATGACSLAGIALAVALTRRLARAG